MTPPKRAAIAVLMAAATTAALAQTLHYPVTKKVDHVDVYHGTKVPDPYRWLEDDMSAQTAAWVEAQNKVTFPYLEAIPYRAQLHARVKQVSDYASTRRRHARAPTTSSARTTGCRTRTSCISRRGWTGRRRC